MSKTSGRQTISFGIVEKDGVNIEIPERSFNEYLNGHSKFVQGRQFKVTGFGHAYQKPKDGSDPAVNANVFPILTTDIGDDTNIWVKSIIEPKLDVRNQPVVNDGTASEIIRKIHAEKGDDSENTVFLPALAEALKDLTLVVRRKFYVGWVYPENQSPYTKTMSIPCFDIKK